ncbi:MAG TPA: ferritin family protein [Chitinivibrionales bacterium]|jgi:rubrerythrin|nr:ferritin family protein [Chitinivibrionales bacterium]
MNMLDLAIEIETEGMKFYAKLAEQTPNREISGIFHFFLMEEKRHHDIFDAWEKNIVAPPLENIHLAAKAGKVFRSLSEGFDRAGVPAIDHEDAYKKALTLEKKSISFYEDMQKDVDDEEQKMVLALIIQQERTHATIINQLMEFQRHPNEWLENAEWNHYEDY